MDGANEDTEGTGVASRLRYFAWRWYRIRGDKADDIVQSAWLTYMEVRERYAGEHARPDLLLGILRNKCREHIARRIRTSRALTGLRAAAEAGETAIPVLPTPSPDAGVVDELVHREDERIILEALGEVRPKAREMFRLLAEGATRKDLIRRFGLNPNTLDSRLHAYRVELREILEERGVPV